MTVRVRHSHAPLPQAGDRWRITVRNIADSTAATKRWSDRSCIGASWRGISDHAGQGPTRPWRGFKNHPPTHGQRHRLRVFWQAKQGSTGAGGIGTGGVSRRVEIARDDAGEAVIWTEYRGRVLMEQVHVHAADWGNSSLFQGVQSSKLIVLKVKLWGMLKWRRGKVDEPRLILMDDSAFADS